MLDSLGSTEDASAFFLIYIDNLLKVTLSVKKGKYFLKHFRAGLQHCQSEMADLSPDYKIPFKNQVYFSCKFINSAF